MGSGKNCYPHAEFGASAFLKPMPCSGEESGNYAPDEEMYGNTLHHTRGNQIEETPGTRLRKIGTETIAEQHSHVSRSLSLLVVTSMFATTHVGGVFRKRIDSSV